MRRYYRANEECSRSRAHRFGLPLALGLFTLFVVMTTALGLVKRWGIIIASLALLWVFHVLTCYTRLRGRAATLVGSLFLMAMVLFVVWNFLELLDAVLDLEH